MASAGGLYDLSMDPDKALELTQKGGTVLILGMPEGTSFGIDHQMFVVGPHFMGIKMVPPGAHFVYCSATSRTGGGSAPVVGSFLHFGQPGRVEVRKWDAAEERLVRIEDEDEEMRFADAARRLEFDGRLGPYNLRKTEAWKRLSAYITPDVIDRIAPVGGEICVLDEADPGLLRPSTAAEARLAEQLGGPPTTAPPAAGTAADTGQAGHAGAGGDLPMEEVVQTPPGGAPPSAEEARRKGGGGRKGGGRCFYSDLPRLVRAPGMTAAELTAANLDKSAALESALAGRFGGEGAGLLGEMQFAFVAFMMGQSLEAFAQWKAVIHLLCGCHDAPLGPRAPLFQSFLGALQDQLSQGLISPGGGQGGGGHAGGAGGGAPLRDVLEGLMGEDVLAPAGGKSFLRELLGGLFGTLLEAGEGFVHPGLWMQAGELQAVLREGLGWDFRVEEMGGEEDDEYAPVVVEMG